MKNIFDFLSFTILFVVLILPVTAQQTQKLSSGNTDSVEKGVLTKYDAAKNETSIYIYPYLEIYESERNSLRAETLTMTAGFSHSGKDTVSKPSSVELGFISTVKTTWRFAGERERKLTIVIDDGRFELGTLSRINTKTVPIINQQNLRYIENLAMFIPFETFQKMAEAKKVAVKVGSYEIKLRKEHLQVLRELLSRAN
jgi:hypothetical protein